MTEALATDADPLKAADPSTPIWTEKVKNKQLLSLRFLTVPEEACKRAGVERKIAFHDIRRSRAKLLGSKHGLNLWTLRARFGWLRGELEDLVDPVEDDATSEDIKPRTPIQCHDCGAWAPREQPCLWCGTNPSTQS